LGSFAELIGQGPGGAARAGNRSVPRTGGGVRGGAAYLRALDQALIDRIISAREPGALVELADASGIRPADAAALHRQYLAELAGRALADGVLDDSEKADLNQVAGLLGLTARDVADALSADAGGLAAAGAGSFALRAGDSIVFTGQMARPRGVWEADARTAGLTPQANVTKKTVLVVAADPDSLSGKARKAVEYGIPIIAESSFGVLLEGLAD
jgi:DNA polymerase-3 subunit epsilon